MDNFPDYLKGVVTKLSENERKEIDIIELIINANEKDKEQVKEKVIRFI